MSETFDYVTENGHKSNLLLQATLFREQGQLESATALFAEVAAIEERLAVSAEEQGNIAHALRHRFSAASGWAQAGDFHHALSLLRNLEAHPDTPTALRKRIQTFAEVVQKQREGWARALSQASLS